MATVKAENATATRSAARVGSPAWLRLGRGWLRPDGMLVLLITALALGMSLFRLGRPSIWMDEAFSVALARQPLAVLAGAFTGGEPNMLLYHVLLHFWLIATGWLGVPANELVVRLPSALCFGLSAPVVFLLGKRLLGRIAGCTAALLFLFNPLALTYAQQTRSYALQVLLVSLSWYALVTALASPKLRVRWWAAYTVLSVCAIYAHAFSLLVLLAQAVAYVLLLALPTWRANARRSLGPIAASYVSILVLIAPLLYVSRSGSKTGWLPAPNVSSLASHYSGVLVNRGGRGAALALLAAVLVAGAVYLLARWPTARKLLRWVSGLLSRGEVSKERPQGAAAVLVVLLAWLLVPVVVSFVVSQGPVRLFSSRYLVVVVPAFCLLLGFAVASIRLRAAQIICAAGLVCVALLFVSSYYAHAEVENWRGPTRWLEHEYKPGDGLVCYDNVQGCQIAVEYYLVTDHSAATFAPDSPGALHLDKFGHGDPFAGFGAALDPTALDHFGATHSRIFYIAGRLADAKDQARVHAVEAWLDCHYHFIGQTSNPAVTIRLYSTNTSQAACSPLP